MWIAQWEDTYNMGILLCREQLTEEVDMTLILRACIARPKLRVGYGHLEWLRLFPLDENGILIKRGYQQKMGTHVREMFVLGQADPKPTRVLDTIAGGHTMIPQKFYHPNASRNALGLIGGNEVSVASGNLVDVESDLRSITRDLSRDPKRQYQPTMTLGPAPKKPAPANVESPIQGGSVQPWPTQLVFTERSTGKIVTVSTAPRHLPTTQYVSYPGVPAPAPFVQEVYGQPWRF